MVRLAPVVLLTWLAACTVNVELVRVGEGVEQAGAAIDAVWQAHIAAAQRKDVAGVVALYADDVLYAVAGQPEVRGRLAIEAMERSGMQTTEVVAAAHVTVALRVDGCIAHELGTVSGDVATAGQPAKQVVFHYAAAWRCGEDGVWRIVNLVGNVEGTAGRNFTNR